MILSITLGECSWGLTCGLTQSQGIPEAWESLLYRAKLWELQVKWMGYILVGLPFLVGGNSYLYVLLSYSLMILSVTLNESLSFQI